MVVLRTHHILRSNIVCLLTMGNNGKSRRMVWRGGFNWWITSITWCVRWLNIAFRHVYFDDDCRTSVTRHILYKRYLLWWPYSLGYDKLLGYFFVTVYVFFFFFQTIFDGTYILVTVKLRIISVFVLERFLWSIKHKKAIVHDACAEIRV